MAEKILGIDIHGDSIAAVHVKKGMWGYHVTACTSVVIEDGKDLADAFKLLYEKVELKTDICSSTIPGERVSYRNLQMPFRSAKKIMQTIAYEIETMVPFPVEDVIVDFINIDQPDQHSNILAASVGREYISEYLNFLQGYGVNPHILDINGIPLITWLLRHKKTPDDGLFLEIGLKRNMMVFYRKRRISVIRSLPFCVGLISETISNLLHDTHAENQADEPIVSCFESFCTNVKHTLYAFEYQNNIPAKPEKVFVTGIGSLYPNTVELLERFLDIPVEEVNVAVSDSRIHMDETITKSWNSASMDSALALAIQGSKHRLGFNFRKDGFEPQKSDMKLKREFRRIAVFSIVILSLLAAYFSTDYYFLNERYRMLDKQITDTFKQTIPNVKRIIDPVQQMRVKVNQIKQSVFSLPGIVDDQRFIDLLLDISLRVPKSLDVQVTRMAVDPETVKIIGETDTFNTVDIIKKELQNSEYFSEVTINSANLNGSSKRVRFEIKLKRTK